MASRLSYLFDRFLQKTATPEEREEFFSLVHDDANSAELNLLVEEALKQDHAVPDLEEDKATAIFTSILEAEREIAPLTERRRKPFRRWLYIAAAACTVVAVSVLMFYPNKAPVQLAEAEKDIKNALPGYNNATLILGNGKSIRLDSTGEQTIPQGNVTVKNQGGHLLYEGSHEPVEQLFNTLITPRGGQYHITLPDKTEVWLNAASSLRYPIAFSEDERMVELNGEAYFEIAKDASKPFLVKTGNTTVQVLGTRFNIMAYDNEHTVRTTLVEGAVKVVTAKDAKVLSPGHYASVDPSTEMIGMGAADIEEAIAWKEGYFLFRGANLSVMLRQFERWYNIDIVLKAPQKTYEFMGKIPRTARFSSVLKLLEVNNIAYELDQNKLIIQP